MFQFLRNCVFAALCIVWLIVIVWLTSMYEVSMP